jgi:uncharacterized protein CbrC (UPF0167 family)
VTIKSLPDFRYHPDPLGSGSVIASAESCDACGQARGYVYDGPVYAEDDQWVFCPWCIADGTAARRYDAEFTPHRCARTLQLSTYGPMCTAAYG